MEPNFLDCMKKASKDIKAGETLGTELLSKFVDVSSDPANTGSIATVAAACTTSVIATVYLALSKNLSDKQADNWLTIVLLDLQTYLSGIGKKIAFQMVQVDK